MNRTHGHMEFCSHYQCEQKLCSCLSWLLWEHSCTVEHQWPPASMTHEQDLPSVMSQPPLKPVRFVWIYTLVYSQLLYFSQWNIDLNDLISLSLDLNRFTCYILLDTVNLIGWECRPRPNHKASPRSLAANDKDKDGLCGLCVLIVIKGGRNILTG